MSSQDNSDKPTKSKGKKKPSPASAQDTNNGGSKSQDTNNGGSKSQDTNNGNKATKVNSNNCDVKTLDFTSSAMTKDKT